MEYLKRPHEEVLKHACLVINFIDPCGDILIFPLLPSARRTMVRGNYKAACLEWYKLYCLSVALLKSDS